MKCANLILIRDSLKRTPGGHQIWVCKCICGKTVELSTERIQKLKDPSCGCKNQVSHRSTYKIGDKLGDLTIINKTKKRFYKNIVWTCKCSCGKTIDISTSVVSRRHKKSKSHCGCKNKKKHHVLYWNFYSYKKLARRKNRDFFIEEFEFYDLVNRPCFYCGFKSSVKNKVNGIDRIDNNKGYINGNMNPCCQQCNYGKQEQPLEEFISWIKRVHDHIGLSSNLPSSQSDFQIHSEVK